jgi:hypothetical protein
VASAYLLTAGVGSLVQVKLVWREVNVQLELEGLDVIFGYFEVDI